MLNNSKGRWAIVAVVVALSVLYAVTLGDWVQYAQSWGGTAFRAMSGAVLGWITSRYVVALDLSSLPPEQRPLAGLSQAVVIGAFTLALATGV